MGLDKFLDGLASHTGIRLTPVEFGKICIEAADAAEKQNAKDAEAATEKTKLDAADKKAAKDKEPK
jgi:hypothetical protein